MDKLTLLKPIVESKARKLLEEAKKKGIVLIVTSSLRTFAEQDALYAQGRTKPGNIVTNAKAGQSWHNWACAFDVVALKNGSPDWNCDWSEIGKLGESVGLEWGGRWVRFVDRPHFQYTAGYSLADFQRGKIEESKFDTSQSTKLKETIRELIEKLATLIKSKKRV